MGEHWRKPFPPKHDVAPKVRPSVIEELAALIRSTFHVDWLPFDETRATFRRRFAGGRNLAERHTS